MRAIEQLPGDEDFFDMANLPPEVTGLPMVVWVSQRGRARHAARVMQILEAWSAWRTSWLVTQLDQVT